MVRLTAELISQGAQFMNPVKDYELDLRGYKVPVIENLGATLDQFDTIDLTDNEIRKLDGFPLLNRLSTLLLSNNKICRIADNLEASLPKLRTLVLTNNLVAELGDLDALSTVATLETLSLLRNPVTTKKNYRYYVIHKVPQLRVLDFRRIKMKEREAAKKMFKGERGAALAAELGQKSKTFTPGAPVVNGASKPAPSAQAKQDMEAIKLAIANAKSLEEVEHLKNLLRAGQVPQPVNPMGTAAILSQLQNPNGNGHVEEEDDEEEDDEEEEMQMG